MKIAFRNGQPVIAETTKPRTSGFGSEVAAKYPKIMAARDTNTLKTMLMMAARATGVGSGICQTITEGSFDSLRRFATHYALRSAGMELATDDVSSIASMLTEDARFKRELSGYQKHLKMLAEENGYQVTIS